MRILLTGANGFIGSHMLDRLSLSDSDITILLRHTSDTSFIEGHLSRARICYGSLESPAALREAMDGVGVVIHCAGKTKTVGTREFYAVNAGGTLNVVEACNAHSGSVARLVFLSSLAVSGPGSPESPVTEDARPRPVSAYGRSKLLAERHIRQRSRVPYTILRPAAVYGPRDREFHAVFEAIRRGFMPLVGTGARSLSLIYVTDLVEAVSKVIGCARCERNTYHLAHAVPSTQRDFFSRIAQAMGVAAVPLPMPVLALYAVCLARDLWSRITSRPSMMNLDKIAEIRASGWVCATDRAVEDFGFSAGTSLGEGIGLTLAWYEENGWL